MKIEYFNASKNNLASWFCKYEIKFFILTRDKMKFSKL